MCILKIFSLCFTRLSFIFSMLALFEWLIEFVHERFIYGNHCSLIYGRYSNFFKSRILSQNSHFEIRQNRPYMSEQWFASLIISWTNFMNHFKSGLIERKTLKRVKPRFKIFKIQNDFISWNLSEFQRNSKEM